MATTITTTTTTTVRQALASIRADLTGQHYFVGPLEYPCDQGMLLVRNAPAEGGLLLGVFEAELVNKRGETVQRYEV